MIRAVAAASLLGAAALGVGPVASAAAASVGPTCVPTALNRSAALPGTPLSVSPLPGTMVASPASQISMVGAPVGQITSLTVTGSRSGAHSGKLVGYSQSDGASFVPKSPFTDGEAVTVKGAVHSGSSTQPFSFTFNVAYQNPLPHPAPGAQPVGGPGDVQSFRSRPDLRPPAVAVTANAAGVAPGDIFATPYSGPGQDGPMIFDNSGQIIWFKPLPTGTESTNLQVQQLDGRPVLTWWQGYIPPTGSGQGQDMIVDTSYHPVQTVYAGNGFAADLHEFQLTAKDTALLTVVNAVHCNLSPVGGARDGAVTDSIYQEIDLHTGLVRREWHALDHVALAESYQAAAGSSTEFPDDYLHVNSLSLRPDGTILASARNTWAMYILSGQTGQILARIGGKHSNVKMGPGTATAWQHDARSEPDGTITVFDNGATPVIHPYSRGLVESIDPKTNTITVVRQFIHATPLSSASQGNFQLLPGGDGFIGWGAQPYYSEVSPTGQLLFDAHMPHGDLSYRALRFQWTGTPTSVPRLALTVTTHGTPVAYASWNGSTQVDSWKILTGTSASKLSATAASRRAGFETTIPLAKGVKYAAAQAVSSTGAVLATSAPRPVP